MEQHVIDYLTYDMADFIVTMPKPEYKGMGANIHYDKYNRLVSSARRYLMIKHPDRFNQLKDLGMLTK